MNVIIIILGLSVGSFINAAVYRLKNGRSAVSGRSFCPKCGINLKWRYLIPVISYVFLRGRCAHCQRGISLQYPFIELLTGLSFFFFVYFNPTLPIPLLAIYLAIISALIFIALYDYKFFLIPDSAIVLGVLAALALVLLNAGYKAEFISAILLTGFLGSIFWISKGEWLGFGDVKLAILIGLFNGPFVIVTLMLASWGGLLVGIYLIFFKGGTLKSRLPFGTFLALASIIVATFQARIGTIYDYLFF